MSAASGDREQVLQNEFFRPDVAFMPGALVVPLPFARVDCQRHIAADFHYHWLWHHHW